MQLELPADLTDDMEVLFVNPYHPDDSKLLHLSGGSDEQLKSLFKKAESWDPGFQAFEDKVAAVKTLLGLGGYVIGDDLILLYGDRKALEKAHNSLKDDYTCFFDTVGGFLKFAAQEDAAVVIQEKKPKLN